MVNEPIIFRDGICPECGETCGNGGIGDTFRCLDCGWTGKLSSADEAAIQEFIRQHNERNGVEGEK